MAKSRKKPVVIEAARFDGNLVACCGSCRFWQSGNGQAGFCRRFPPTTGIGIAKLYPLTGAVDWCGEYQQPSL
jgi:hypothetical protein